MATDAEKKELRILREIISHKQVWNGGIARQEEQGWTTYLVRSMVVDRLREVGLEWGGPYNRRAGDGGKGEKLVPNDGLGSVGEEA